MFAMGVVALFAAGALRAQSAAAAAAAGEKGHMKHATGTFEVKVVPADASEIGKAGGVGRMTIDKVFSGDLTGTSKGEMLTGTTKSTGAMAYVAIETVTAKLDGREGSFVLSHHATMLQNDPSSAALQIDVVPSSGTGELAGLSGSLTITIADGKHHYDLAYTLPAK